MVKRALIEQFADAERLKYHAPLQRSEQGCVVWITGLSGAGKTTVGNILKSRLLAKGRRTIFLDGDALRGVFAIGDRFDPNARLELARSYGRLCQLLASQGHTVICATISMRNVVYDWNRKNLPNYLEVFLDVPLDVRQARDPKGYYAAVHNGTLNNFAGQDQRIDVPPSPDIHIAPESTVTPEEICDQIEATMDKNLSVEGQVA